MTQHSRNSSQAKLGSHRQQWSRPGHGVFKACQSLGSAPLGDYSLSSLGSTVQCGPMHSDAGFYVHPFGGEVHSVAAASQVYQYIISVDQYISKYMGVCILAASLCKPCAQQAPHKFIHTRSTQGRRTQGMHKVHTRFTQGLHKDSMNKSCIQGCQKLMHTRLSRTHAHKVGTRFPEA